MENHTNLPGFVNKPKPKQKRVANVDIRPLLVSAMRRSYAHGLARIVQARHFWIRIMWAAVCCACTCLFLVSLCSTVRRLMASEVATYVDQGSSFEFPDVYLCNNHAVSGSYHTRLTTNQVNKINSHLNATMKILLPILKSVVNNTHQKRFIKYWASKYSIYSLPYRLLVDWLALRKNQSVITALLRSTVPVSEPEKSVNVTRFHHHIYPSCFRLELSKEATDALRCTSSDSNTGVDLMLFLDPPNDILQRTWKSRVPIRNLYLPDGSDSLLVWDWSLADAPTYLSPGLRVFLAPRGHYPSQYVTNFLLSPGANYRIRLHSEEDVRDSREFPGECVDRTESEPGTFYDPYDGSDRNYQYSYFACVTSEWNRLSTRRLDLCNRTFTMLPGRNQVYYNISGLNASQVDHILRMAFKSGANIGLDFGKRVVNKCRKKEPCSQLTYYADISSSKFPGQHSSARFVQQLRGEGTNLSRYPGLSFLFDLANRSKSRVGHGCEQELHNYLEEAFVRLHFSVSRGGVRRIVRTYAYKFPNFISDLGGILGLYLGMSVMVVCELIETVIEVVLLRIKLRRNTILDSNAGDGSIDKATESTSVSTTDLAECSKTGTPA